MLEDFCKKNQYLPPSKAEQIKMETKQEFHKILLDLPTKIAIASTFPHSWDELTDHKQLSMSFLILQEAHIYLSRILDVSQPRMAAALLVATRQKNDMYCKRLDAFILHGGDIVLDRSKTMRVQTNPFSPSILCFRTTKELRRFGCSKRTNQQCATLHRVLLRSSSICAYKTRHWRVIFPMLSRGPL
jgi:hypothetical protein